MERGYRMTLARDAETFKLCLDTTITLNGNVNEANAVLAERDTLPSISQAMLGLIGRGKAQGFPWASYWAVNVEIIGGDEWYG